MMVKVYDGTNMILGRLATKVAKDALLGEEVRVVNCEKVVVSGRKVNTFDREKQRRDRRGHPLKSVKIPRLADRFVRRTIRGMLPWKQARGKEAFKRIMCYRGIPEELANEKTINVEGAATSKLPMLYATTVADIMKNLGGKEQ